MILMCAKLALSHERFARALGTGASISPNDNGLKVWGHLVNVVVMPFPDRFATQLRAADLTV